MGFCVPPPPPQSNFLPAQPLAVCPLGLTTISIIYNRGRHSGHGLVVTVTCTRGGGGGWVGGPEAKKKFVYPKWPFNFGPI